ncbi:prolyl oligopeptidase family serine peptidase [Anaerolineales bacterium]
MNKTQKPYGQWSSPIGASDLALSLRLNDVKWDTNNDTLVWHERRAGKGILTMQSQESAPRELNDERVSVGGGIGYGGGYFSIHEGFIYFCDGSRIFKQNLSGGMAKAITPEYGQVASPAISPDGKWMVYIFSDQHNDGLAIVDTDGQHWPQKLLFDSDFVMQPVWNPNGQQIACVTWQHPYMPWNQSELKLIDLEIPATGLLPFVKKVNVLKAADDVAISQPAYSPDGKYLSYLSDESDWVQIYFYDLKTGQHQQITDAPADHGGPAWIQDMRHYAWQQDSQNLVYILNEKGFMSVWNYKLAEKVSERIDALNDYTYFEQISSGIDHQIAMVASSPTQATRIISYSDEKGIRVHKRSETENLDQDFYSEAQALVWPGKDGGEVHGLFYPAHNPGFEAKGLAPVIIKIHGGPSSQQRSRFELETQFFTSRGIAVLHVNHRGSTGYGKEYLNRHQYQWGIIDVEDSVAALDYLKEKQLADSDRAVILGGSAGGYTVLQALCDYPNRFKAGICAYGISNLFTMEMATHKFESHYNSWLIGPLPETAERWRERSPLFKADQIRDPLFIFHGKLDKVVPIDQAESLIKSLKGLYFYHMYENEGHSWRYPETIKDYYERVLEFLLLQVIYA